VTADFGPVKGNVEFSPADAWLHTHDDFGASLYDVHKDSSGFCYSTRSRPILNMRPGYVSWLTGSPRHFSADLAILGWLEQQEVAYDVATDGDLHNLGSSAFAGYDVVVTGTHPEYQTGRMLDGMAGYVDSGGRLMYLGGNGFYWVTGVSPERPDVIEVRRGQAGTRTWQSQPGEIHLASTGEPGGLWVHRGDHRTGWSVSDSRRWAGARAVVTVLPTTFLSRFEVWFLVVLGRGLSLGTTDG
jgi:N,N-dimethylformamidase